MKQAGFTPILIVILVAAGIVGGYFVYQNTLPSKSEPEPTQKACTLEAKLCPDGSAVGRSGPNCEFTPCPTPESTDSADISGLKTYTDSEKNYSFKYPNDWKENLLQVLGDKSVLEISDTKGVYSFSFTKQANYNNDTGKPFESIDEFINMPYKVKTVIVDGQEAAQPLPRAGSENINGVFFFSKDSKFIYNLELTTNNPDNESQGQAIFNQILSTFKFLD